MFTFGYFMVRVTNKAAVGVINKQVTTLWRHIVECGEHVVLTRPVSKIFFLRKTLSRSPACTALANYRNRC